METSTTIAEPTFTLKPVRIGRRSRLLAWLLRCTLRPFLKRQLRAPLDSIARMQRMTASQRCSDTAGFELAYRVLGEAPAATPGHVLGNVADTGKPVLLWLHGGAFVLPAAPNAQIAMVARLARALGANAFMPDYRLAPQHRFPAALDDCENAYAALLALGFAPRDIVLGGESAGGNLVLGLLQRIRRRGWANPACAVTLSPVTELGREFGLPSRLSRGRQDALLSVDVMHRVVQHYVGSHDCADPEVSPLYADCRGFPPLYILASDAEILRDDAVYFAQRARQAGVAVRLEVWPALPHGFPVFGKLFREAAQAEAELADFVRGHLAHRAGAVYGAAAGSGTIPAAEIAVPAAPAIARP
jgi:acetyl esterase/lipase